MVWSSDILDYRPGFRLTRTRPNILDGLLNSLDASLRIWMRAEEFRRLVALLRLGQHLHDADQIFWIVPSIVDEAHAQEIGLELVIASELHVNQLAD